MEKTIYMIKMNGFVQQDCYTSLKEACKHLDVSYSTAKQAAIKSDFIIFFSSKDGQTKEIYRLRVNKIKGRGQGNKFIKVK